MNAAEASKPRALRVALALAVLAAAFSQPSRAGEPMWRELHARAEQAVLAGGYSEAVGLAQAALEEAGRAGEEVAQGAPAAQDLLGYVLFLTGDYVTAESYLRKALAQRESALGPTHPAVAQTLERLSLLYQKTGRHGEAVEQARRAVAIR